MPVIDPNNPLSAIGASNDPTLTQRTIDMAGSANDLQSKLGQILQTGQQQRMNTQLTGDINDRNTRNEVLLGKNINPNSPTAMPGFASLAKITNAGTKAVAPGKHTTLMPAW